MENLKKLSVKALCGLNKLEIGALVASLKDGEGVLVATVAGIVSKTMAVETPHGVATKLLGAFEGKCHVQGKEHTARSAVCYLPGNGADMIAAAGDLPVSFGYEILVERCDNSATGYTYTLVDLLPPSEDDPLSRLVGSIGKKAKGK